MTRQQEEIKALIHAVRDLDVPVGDASVDAAREAARRDPEIVAWAEREQAFDRQFAARLREIPVPAGLRSRILEACADEPESGEGDASASNVIIPWWQSPAIYAIAASVAIVAVVGILLLRQPALQPGATAPATATAEATTTATGTDMQAWFEAVGLHAQGFSGLDFRNGNMEEIRSYLANHQVDAPGAIPGKFPKDNPMGCLTVEIGGRQVGMICFKSDKLYHLYVTDRAGMGEMPEAQPQFRQFGDVGAAAWADRERFYILTVDGESAENLGKLL